MAQRLDDTLEQRAIEMMEKFDATNQTLVDYFAIIGPDNDLLSNLIQELKSNDHVQGGEYTQPLGRQSSFNGAIWQESKGKYRVLHPSVLARFPKQERADKLFPRGVDDFFFDQMERVYTKDQVEQLQRDNDPD